MTNQDSRFSMDPLSRRAFLRGGACLAGAALIGHQPVSAEAAEAADGPAIGIAYCDGRRLLDPSTIRPSISGTHVQSTIVSHAGSTQTLRGLSVMHRVDGVPQLVPFHAWTASPYGSKPIRFTAPVLPSDGLALSVERASLGACAKTAFSLSPDRSASGPRLRAGTYILAAENKDWSRYRLSTDGRLTEAAGDTQPDFDYLVITICPA